MQLLLTLQRFLAVNRKPITTAFIIFELLVMMIWFAVYIQAIRHYPSVVAYLFELGPLLGQVSIALYITTLMPGIITRLQFLPKVTQPIASIILPFRRHVGILMFITAFVHMSFTTSLPYFAGYNFDPPTVFPPLEPYQAVGLIGWLLLFPMWLTSNDFAVKKLGKWWNRIHRATYVALFLIFGHVALQGQAKWSIVMAAAAVGLVASWIVYWLREAKKQAVQNQVATAPVKSTLPTS